MDYRTELIEEIQKINNPWILEQLYRLMKILTK